MRTGIIYKHVNNVNGKVYIGQTIQKLNRRFRPGKMASAYKSCVLFHAAIVKYTESNFDTIILEENINEPDLISREEYYINLYDSSNPDKGYNIKNIVDNKIIFTDEIKKKMSDKAKLRPRRAQKKKWHVFEAHGETKHCSGCDQWLTVNNYMPFKTKWDGLQANCNDCLGKRRKEYYIKNKEKMNKKSAERTRLKRAQLRRKNQS